MVVMVLFQKFDILLSRKEIESPSIQSVKDLDKKELSSQKML